MKYPIKLTINGSEQTVDVEPNERLASVLRDKLGLTGTKRGCDYGGCGCCTVNVDDVAVYSCMFPAMKANGKRIVTVEGLSNNGELNFIQESFSRLTAFQCAYCTPGFLMSARALLIKNPSPSEEQIREAINGNLCRCTGYVKIVAAILEASKIATGQ
jgi:aerobic-type carbon monoxide dehydrogenase small subunit (CoxS/CutS family)